MKKHTIIIAEAGVNHNGSLEMAKKLVRAAADSGADYVKFQTFRADNIVTSKARKAEYQKINCKDGEDSQLSMLKALELSYKDFNEIASECKSEGIGFLSTPFDCESVAFLSSLDMDFWKIPSGEITNLPLLRKIGGIGGKIILSTGMSDLMEVIQAVEVLESAGTMRSNIVLLHCTTQYPAPYESVNLRAMDTLATIGCGGVGYSDHTAGIEVAIAAVARGACVVEKHFTLDKSLPGPDHRASLDPSELSRMVDSIRNIELSLGSEVKAPSREELNNIAVARKCIVASRYIRKGEILTDENLTAKRSGEGLSPMFWDKVIGTKAMSDFMPDTPIYLSDISSEESV